MGLGMGRGMGMGQCWAVGPSAQLCPLHWGWRFHGPKFARGGCAKGGCERAHKCACKTTCKWECTKRHANGRARHTASVPPAPAGGAPEGHGAARGARRGTRLRGTRACTRGRGRPGDPQSPPPRCCPGPPRVHCGLGERARHRGGGGVGGGWNGARDGPGAAGMETGTKAQRGRDEQRWGQSGAGGGEAGEDGGGDGKGAGTGGGRAGGGTATGTATVKAAGTGRRRPGAAGQPAGGARFPPASPAPGPGPALTGAARRRTGCAAPGCAALHRDALRCGARRAAAPSLPFLSLPPGPDVGPAPVPAAPAAAPAPTAVSSAPETPRNHVGTGRPPAPSPRAAPVPPRPVPVRPSVRFRSGPPPTPTPERGSAPRSPVGAEPGQPLGEGEGRGGSSPSLSARGGGAEG